MPHAAPAAPLRALPHPFAARGLYHLLYKRWKLPRDLVHGVLSAAKRPTVYGEVRKRRALAAQLPSPAPGALVLDATRAYQHFTAQTLPGAADIAAYCAARFEDFQRSGAAAQELERNPKKRFLLSVIAGDAFCRHPALLRFMVSRPIVEAAARYLGTVPVLEGAALWWTPVNDTVSSSQCVHIDELAQRQVKVMMNCLPTARDQGPFTFLPADRSAQVRAAARHRRGRLEDRWLDAVGAAPEMIELTGPAGSGAMLDSSRCLHYGSRGNQRDRLVLTFHFMPLDAPTETRYRLRVPAGTPGLENLDSLERRALGLA